MYFLLGVIIAGIIFCICLMYKMLYILGDILFKENEIKKYQYSNNIKLLGFIKKLFEKR